MMTQSAQVALSARRAHCIKFPELSRRLSTKVPVPTRQKSLLPRTVGSVTGRLFIVFAFYLIADVGYGLWYFRLYQGDQTRFLFAADIASAQQRVHVDQVKSDLADIRRQLYALSPLVQSLASADSGMAFTSHFSFIISHAYRALKQAAEGEVRFFDGPASDCPDHTRFACTPFGSVEVLNGEGRILATIPVGIGSIPDPRSAASAKAAVDSLARTLQIVGLRLEAELHDERAIARNAWSFGDFVYFSTITQMTVGYGDIVPNSSIVRAVVVSQLVVNGFFLLVLLNFVLASPLFTTRR